MDEDSTNRPTLLERVRDELAATVDDVVERFYTDLAGRAGSEAVLARLGGLEVERLKAHQAEQLLSVLDPERDEQQAYERARRIGRVHAMVGVDIEWYAAALSRHHQEIFDVVGTLPDLEEQAGLYSVVLRRLVEDLQGSLAGYRDVDAAHHQAMMRIHDAVSSAGTVPDLVHGVLEACTGVDGIEAGFFGRPDARNVFLFEMGIGPNAEEFMGELEQQGPLTISVLSDDVRGRGPSGRAWRSGRIERSDAYLTDPTTAPWHRLGERLGWRSSAAVPISSPQGQMRALLSLYSSWPGFFSTREREAMLLQVKQMLESALAALEARGTVASGVRAYSTRASYLSKLSHGEVRMLYQPVVELGTGRVRRVEALGRLVDGDRLLRPAQFLPAFGDDELFRLFDLGLDQALAASRRWVESGHPLGVSLNLPARAVDDHRYLSLVGRALERHRVAPGTLTLELLETGEVDGEPRSSTAVLERIKSLGVRLAQDDLGAGYSSLLRLRRVDFDEIKLDQDLVRGRELEPRGALSFVRPLTDLAHSMGLSVVVEGLENHGLVEAAYALGANAGQGYGLSRPIPQEQVVDWVRGFSLDLDPENPRTHLGGLAGHVAWEHRSSASPPSSSVRFEEACPLDRFLDRVGGDPEGQVREAHAQVHRACRTGRGTADHLHWWRLLVRRVASQYA